MGKDISIIIPHYNSFVKLERLLKSIVKNNRIQVIVVDDNSEEFNEQLLIKNYGCEVYYNDNKNKGAGICRNIGLKKAIGKWILFADADDFFLEDTFNILKKYFNNNQDIIYFSPISIRENDGKISTRHLHHEFFIEYYFFEEKKENIVYNLPEPWSKLIRREIIDKNDIHFSEIEVANDRYFSVKVGYYAKKILVKKEQIYCITENKDSLTSNENQNRLKIRLEEAIKIIIFMKEKTIPKEFHPFLMPLIYKMSKFNYILALKYMFVSVCRNYRLLPSKKYFQLLKIKKKVKNE